MRTRTLRAALGLAAVSLITVTFRFVVPVNLTTAGFAYLITILLVAARWGLLGAVCSSIAATLCFNYFFLPPVGTLHIADPENWVALTAFLVTSLVASQLSEMARRNHDFAVRAEAAQQSEQFRSTLLDAVAHEFKTPLTSIKAATSAILTAESITDDQRHELLTVINQETDRLSRLITEAFHLARAETGKMNLSRTLQNVEALVAETLKQSSLYLKGRQVQTECASALPQVHVDAELFVVSLKQLVDNAARYSPPDTPVRITAEASADSVWVRVHNQGPGLTERERMMVFERFYRSPATSQNVSGTGIGLAIAQDIVKAHGGVVDVESGPGMGTEFSIRLPIVKGERS